MKVFIVLNQDVDLGGDKIEAVFLDPLKAEEYRKKHDCKIIEKHSIKDVAKLRIMTVGDMRMIMNASDFQLLKEKGTLV